MFFPHLVGVVLLLAEIWISTRAPKKVIFLNEKRGSSPENSLNEKRGSSSDNSLNEKRGSRTGVSLNEKRGPGDLVSTQPAMKKGVPQPAMKKGALET